MMSTFYEQKSYGPVQNAHKIITDLVPAAASYESVLVHFITQISNCLKKIIGISSTVPIGSFNKIT